MSTFAYMPPTLTVDSVLFQLIDNRLSVLLIQRAREPFKGVWALPGGYCSAGETTKGALGRVLHDKAGIRLDQCGLVEQLYTFDTVARDPRGHAVSVSYMVLCRDLVPGTSKGMQNPMFYHIDAVPALAYDHAEIIAYAHQRLKSKLSYTNAVFALLPPEFTLTHLQAAYEAILMRPLDKRNFRKKFLSLSLIEATDHMLKEGAHRPARLYRFKQADLQVLTRSFD